MPYHIYQTTNQINHKYYIGVTNGNKPNYLGSGTALIKAIKEHGRHNFKREILETYDTEAEAFKREAEIVNEAFVKDRNTYNMKVGGFGGVGQSKSDEHRRNLSKTIKALYDNGHSSMGGRPPAMDKTFLYDMVSQYGFKGAAQKLDLSYQQVKNRYYRARDSKRQS
jgi:DNA-directed RNA polymerase specialized sigma24 family protein